MGIEEIRNMTSGKIRRILTCILIMLLVMTAGCDSGYNDKADTQKMIGTWVSDEVDVSKVVNKLLIEDYYTDKMYDYVKLDILNMKLVMEIRNDGTYVRGIQEASIDAALEYADQFWENGILKYYEDELRKRGETMSARRALSVSGVDIEDVLDHLNVRIKDALLEKAIDKGYYVVKKGNFYKSAEPIKRSLPRLYDKYILGVDEIKFIEFGAEVSEDLAQTEMKEVMNKFISFHLYKKNGESFGQTSR